MFERFTDRTRRALVAAHAEAADLDDGSLRPAHIMLGLLRIGEGVAYHVLTEAGIFYETARRQLEGRPPEPDAAPLDGEALSSLGIDLAAVREAVDASFGDGAFDSALGQAGQEANDESRYGSFLLRRSGKAAFTDQSKAVLRRSLEEALALKHHYIGTEHVLLALVQLPDADVARILGSVPSTGDLRALVLSRIRQAS